MQRRVPRANKTPGCREQRMWAAPPRRCSTAVQAAGEGGVRCVQQSCSRVRCRRFLSAAALPCCLCWGRGTRAALPARASACALETLQVPTAMLLRVRLMLQHNVCRVSAAAILTGWAGRGGVGVAAQRRVGVSESRRASQSRSAAVRERSYQDQDGGVVTEFSSWKSSEATRQRAAASSTPEAGADNSLGCP